MSGRKAYEATKRLIDIIGSVVALVVGALPMLIIAAVVKLDSRGPALFRQTRTGRDGAPFTMYKFRTMIHGNDPRIHEQYYKDLVEGTAEARAGDDGEQVFLLDDPRITRVGKHLRRLSLDELPNLINVLKGDMSLVGPRPPIPYEVEMYDDRSLRRLEVRPGLTGLAQVKGRGSLTFEEIIEYDIEYVESRSTRFDLWILARTVPAVLFRRGV